MLDEENLSKYKTEIDDDIAKLIKEYGLTTESEINTLTFRYKQNFIKGFQEGIEIGEARLREEKLKAEERLREEKLKIAQEMLKSSIDINLISQITNLTLDQIKEIQGR